MATKLPAHILRHVRASENAGHRLVSQGCALFRCTQCNLHEFLDQYPSQGGLGKRCEKQPELPAPRNW